MNKWEFYAVVWLVATLVGFLVPWKSSSPPALQKLWFSGKWAGENVLLLFILDHIVRLVWFAVTKL